MLAIHPHRDGKQRQYFPYKMGMRIKETAAVVVVVYLLFIEKSVVKTVKIRNIGSAASVVVNCSCYCIACLASIVGVVFGTKERFFLLVVVVTLLCTFRAKIIVAVLYGVVQYICLSYYGRKFCCCCSIVPLAKGHNRRRHQATGPIQEEDDDDDDDDVASMVFGSTISPASARTWKVRGGRDTSNASFMRS